MKRFFIDAIDLNDPIVSLAGSEAKHITKVMRMGKGDRLIILDGMGRRHQALIDAVKGRKVHLILEKTLPTPPASPVKIVLGQALVKFRQLDYLIQKASELGADGIYIFIADRTNIHLSSDQSGLKLKHWNEIARNAAKQSDKITPAEIVLFPSFKAVLSEWTVKDSLKVILWEEETSTDLKHLLRPPPPVKDFIGIIGPEGGFTVKEIRLAENAGFVPVSLGNRILRSETAATALTAIIQYEWGDLASLDPDG